MVALVVKILCAIARILLTEEQAFQIAARRAVRISLPETAKSVGISTITFGASAQNLSKGALATAHRALELLQRYPEAVILFGEFTLNSVSGLEERLKKEIFPLNAKSFGTVINTIADIEGPLEVLGSDVDVVIFITDEAHSRSVRTIANKILAQKYLNQQVYIDCVSTRDVIDQENPMEALRDPRDWVAVNRFREFILWFPFGFAILKGSGVYQPSSRVE